jgi:hypothetical protein
MGMEEVPLVEEVSMIPRLVIGGKIIQCHHNLEPNPSSSVTEEHGALRHILCRGPFSATFGPLLKTSGNTYDVYCHCRCLFIVIPYNRINLKLLGAPTVGGP